MKQMLIDANHPEETRVVMLDNNQIAEFDFEAQAKAPLRGNIYLAKITRIEPSLQAAFVDYGGNRHGFLPFNEIHPDYFKIPVADREALLEEEAAIIQSEESAEESAEEEATDNENEEAEIEGSIEDIGGGDEAQGAQRANKVRNLYRKYKIQEVIKPNQVIVIQVLKEERGGKGAAVTSYLSLAGRYCVLMPNTARSGGISRRIRNASERKKLKSYIAKLEVPKHMGLIVRTAGSQCTLTEIKRDWKYLAQIWDTLLEKTNSGHAPCLVHEEGNLIRRCVRDIYHKDIDEILVAGKDAHKQAKDYMKLLAAAADVKKVALHKDDAPMFHTFGVENQLAAMFSPVVVLPSGGYLVINQTEALVAVDVNSGKSTRKYSVEQTALATNLEAAVEVARQARLRDLAGLLVIDFIDMDEKRNNRAVEKRLKESLRNDRARLQVGRISNFGLLEMSRQRLRAGVLEGSTSQCHHCNGTGTIRSTESRALHILRKVEEHAHAPKTKATQEAIARGENILSVSVAEEVANYLLANKTEHIKEIEKRSDLKIAVQGDGERAAMEMVFTLPGDKTPRSVERMEGNPDELLAAAKEAAKASNKERNKARSERGKNEDGEGGEGREGRKGKRGGRGRNRKNKSKRDNDEAEVVEETSGEEKADSENSEKKKTDKKRKESPAKSKKVKAAKSAAKKENKKPAKKKTSEKTETKSADDTSNAEPTKKRKGWWSKGE